MVCDFPCKHIMIHLVEQWIKKDMVHDNDNQLLMLYTDIKQKLINEKIRLDEGVAKQWALADNFNIYRKQKKLQNDTTDLGDIHVDMLVSAPGAKKQKDEDSEVEVLNNEGSDDDGDESTASSSDDSNSSSDDGMDEYPEGSVDFSEAPLVKFEKSQLGMYHVYTLLIYWPYLKEIHPDLKLKDHDQITDLMQQAKIWPKGVLKRGARQSVVLLHIIHRFRIKYPKRSPLYITEHCAVQSVKTFLSWNKNKIGAIWNGKKENPCLEHLNQPHNWDCDFDDELDLDWNDFFDCPRTFNELKTCNGTKLLSKKELKHDKNKRIKK